MFRIFGAAIVFIAVIGTGVLYVVQRAPDEAAGLTMQELEVYQVKAKDLNERNDYSLVGMSTKYAEEIGLYNGRIVEFAFTCWGDVCPDNGAYYIRYKDVPKESCVALGGHMVEGYSGWGRMTYGGCSPI
ncbi:hypothetical protein IT396_00545 [Candidatus Nomurabacteria bacterium]|nr:hypothetical protein [Candidatus Nomurabacteria bacterium]